MNENAKYAAIDIAKHLCTASHWKLSQIKVQKLLYLSQLYHVGITNTPLFSEEFEAWHYGPVVREIYEDLKEYGRSSIPHDASCFIGNDVIIRKDIAENILEPLVSYGVTSTVSNLINLCHKKDGAWDLVYDTESQFISIDAIKKEYDTLWFPKK